MNLRCLLVCALVPIVGACAGSASEPAGLPVAAAQAATLRASATPTLDAVRHRDFLKCGVSTGIAGFSAPDAQGRWQGLDVDVCRAIAAAVLGDAAKVRYTPLTAAQRFAALQTGEIDVLSRVTTVTFQRDVELGLEFPAIDWYDGTGFLVRRSSNVHAVKDLDGATICMQPGTSTEQDVADYFRKHRLTFTPVVIERLEEATSAYFAGRCDAFVQDRSSLAAVRARAPRPDQHLLLPDVISKSPFGPAVMPGDPRWIEIVRWSVYAMVDAEELGLSSATIAAALASDDPAIQRFVGRAGGFGAMLGLDRAWAFRIVQQVGSYGESVERHIEPLGVDRGLNRLWKDGGVLYVPDIH